MPKMIRYRETFQYSPDVEAYFCIKHGPTEIGFEASAIIDEIEIDAPCQVCTHETRREAYKTGRIEWTIKDENHNTLLVTRNGREAFNLKFRGQNIIRTERIIEEGQ
jgi:hypothetical protein